jgi:hypothetical protein
MEGGIQRLPEKSSTEDKCIESLQDSFVKISIENTPVSDFPETDKPNYLDSVEWKHLMSIACTHEFQLAIEAVHNFCVVYRDITPDHIERALRKIPNSRVWLFAEDPKLSKFACANKIEHMNKKPAKYVLRFSTKYPRSKAEKDFDPGCRDERENLERLKDAGFCVAMSSEDETENVKYILEGLLGKKEGYFDIKMKDVFDSMAKLSHTNNDIQRLLMKVEIPILYNDEPNDRALVLNPWVLEEKQEESEPPEPRVVEIVE